MGMNTERVLAKLNDIFDWAKNGPPLPNDRKRFQFALVDDWSRFNRVEFDRPEAYAVSIDDQDFFEDQLGQLATPGLIQTRNPSCLVFRIVEPETKTREAVVFVRRRPGLGDKEVVAALQFGAYDPDAARLQSNVYSALAWSGDSTRNAASRRDG